MSHYRYSEESRLSASITPAIAEGHPWTARFIANNNLRQHCHLLARTFRGPHSQSNPIRNPCVRLLGVVEGRCGLLTAVHPSDYPAIPVLVRIAGYSARWIREPETWAGETAKDPSRILHSLLRHLFATWHIPKFFDSAWLVKGELTYLERDWYCHLASGGSMRTVQGMPHSITSRALHLAKEAPCGLTIRQALRWGQVTAIGGSTELVAEVLRSRMVKDLSNDAMWARLLEKLIASQRFNPKYFGLIADTLLEMTLKGTYGRSCKMGRCSIFSVRTDEMIGGKITTTSHITIEVDRRSRRIVQVKGRWNQRIIPQQLPFLVK